MTKVSKPTATRDLAELAAAGAIVREGEGPTTRYRLDIPLCEPIEPINEPINERLLRLIATHPGTQLAYLASVVPLSRATVKRTVAALVAAGKIEHRGSRKTGGYWTTEGTSDK